MLSGATTRSLRRLLATNGLADLPETAFPNDGWSGATLTSLQRGDERFILKRTSPREDWIVRATDDLRLREAFMAGSGPRLVDPLVAPYLGAGRDGGAVAILMPDLSNELIAWERPGGPVIGPATLDRVIDAIARLHAMPWADYGPTSRGWGWPWCPLPGRLLLLSRPAAERYRAEGLTVGDRFLDGWDAFDRTAPAAAVTLIAGLGADSSPLLKALRALPETGLHGDLKLANVALLDDGRVALVDWQLMTLAPVAVELGWLLVSNSALLPIGPDEVLVRYRAAAQRAATEPLVMGGRWPSVGAPLGKPITLPPRGLDATIGDWELQQDLAWIVGLLARGWRKGLDAEAGAVLPTGVSAAHDLAWWSRRALEAAERRL